MGMRMPETCWAVFKRQVINLRHCCIWLFDSFECMAMHGLAKPKFKIKPCRLTNSYKYSEGSYYYPLRCQEVLKDEVTKILWRVTICQSTWPSIPEDFKPETQICENLKPRELSIFLPTVFNSACFHLVVALFVHGNCKPSVWYGRDSWTISVPVWAETGDFRDNAHTMAVAAMDHTQLTFPTRSRTRDRKGTIP